MLLCEKFRCQGPLNIRNIYMVQCEYLVYDTFVLPPQASPSASSSAQEVGRLLFSILHPHYSFGLGHLILLIRRVRLTPA